MKSPTVKSNVMLETLSESVYLHGSETLHHKDQDPTSVVLET